MGGKQGRAQRRLFGMVLLVTLLLAALPSVALAGRPRGGPVHAPRASAPMMLVGTVVEVTPAEAGETKGGEVSAGQAQIVLELETPEWTRRGISRELTLAVDEDAILLAADLSTLELSALAAGDTVMVAPKHSWGAISVQLLYAGTAEELAGHSFRGRLLSGEGDTLQLQEWWGDDDGLTVVVDDATLWMEQGLQDRPRELPEGIPLRILGVKQEDGSVRAVLVAAGRAGL